LKKRTEKLLLVAPRRRFKWADQVVRLTDKSFLVLFLGKGTASFAFACLFL
jgi:hypothetical protein